MTEIAATSRATEGRKPAKGGITSSSTAEYFSKNLQQVGFSSLTKSVLTTLKEAVDNSLDACEDAGILPDVSVEIERVGAGSVKNSERIRIRVEDNGPGIEAEDVPKVFGEYLASSKFGRGRCSRGQQGIGISAATTWAQLTSATGAKVITKTTRMRKALKTTVEVDIKHNRGVLKDKETIDWDRPHGTTVEFTIDGRIQVNGDAGLMNYLMGNVLVNPHLKLQYKLPDQEPQIVERVSSEIPRIPSATEPHPHTMKLGEFIAHSHLFGRVKTSAWLRKGFSRVSDQAISELVSVGGLKKAVLERGVDSLTDADFKLIFEGLQKLTLKSPSTQSVLSIGEDGLSKSIRRVGDIDFFSVVTRKPTICDFKPIQVECAVARLKTAAGEAEDPVQILRFANRVPLQFDKAACAMVQAITSVNWRAYGLAQPKNGMPQGPYIIAVSVVSPFIKFKNASKETVDASDELVEEIRRALIQAGQRLSRHINRERKEQELEDKVRYIEQFGPILVDGLARIAEAPEKRRKKAEHGLLQILGRDAKASKKELDEAHSRLEEHLEAEAKRRGPETETAAESVSAAETESEAETVTEETEAEAAPKAKAKSKTKAKKK